MTIFDILALIGGLSLFLFGMNIMGDSLERRAGGGLKLLLGKLTKNKFMAFLTGLGVTAVIQSSSATTVMVVGFVNSGVMTLKQSIGVIMGANIGTTVTAWILSLGGISGDNLFVKLLKPMSFTPILALIGMIMLMFGKSSKKKDTGMILVGFATLMFGMDTMSNAVMGLANVPMFKNLFLMFKNPILGVLVGLLITAVLQSSSASVGILQALSVTGQVSYAAAIPIIMGQNIGTCVTALISSVGANRNAKRAAVIHLSFNIIGTVFWLSVFSIVSFVFQPAFLDVSASFLGIAVAHSVFNVLCTLLLLPMSSFLEKLALKLIPDNKKKEDVVELDERLLVTPVIALDRCNILLGEMANEATESCTLALNALFNVGGNAQKHIRELEDKTDHYEDIIGTYLIKLSKHQVSDQDSLNISKYLKLIGDYERIADHSLNILESAEELKEKEIEFSAEAKKELEVMCSATSEILELTRVSFVENNVGVAYRIEPLEQVIDEMKDHLRNQHILRLKDGTCTVEAGFVWADILTNLERVSDHCSNVAACIIDTTHNNMNLHQSTKEMKEKDEFEKLYHFYLKKYKIK